jgi:hypothetical protein
MTMLSVRLLLFLTLLSGCDVIWRLDHVDSVNDADLPPGDPITIHGTLQRESLRTSADFTPLVSTGVPADAMLRVAFDDGTSDTPALAADGTFTFTSPHANRPYALTITTMYSARTYELASAQLQLVERLWGREARKPVPLNTTVHVTPSAPPALTSDVAMFTTGIYTRKPLDPTNVGAVFPWTSVETMSGPLGLLENPLDVAYYVEYGATATYKRIFNYGVQHTAVVSGGNNNNMPFQLYSAAALPQLCTNVAIDFAAEKQRVMTAAGAASTAVLWEIAAVPPTEVNPDVLFPLAYSSMDVSGSGGYVNPFDGMTPYLAAVVASDSPKSVQTFVATPAINSCTSPTTIAADLVQIPIGISVGGDALATDGQTIAADRTKPVTVKWTAASGAADYYVTQVVETGATKTLRATYVSTTPAISIDAALFAPGAAYYLVIEAHVGTPNAATGDFAMIGSTFAVGRRTTRVFQIQ